MTGFRQRLAWGIVLAAVSSHSFAQFGGGGRRGRGGDTPPASRPSDAAPSPQTRVSALRDKLYDLRLRLMITPEQGSLWDAFYNKVWDLLLKSTLSRSAAAAEDATAVQLFQQRAAEAQDRAARLKDLADAVDKLYAGLTPEQRHVADQALAGVLA